MCKIGKQDHWWCHALNLILVLYEVYQYSYLVQFASQTIEAWWANSSTGDKPTDIKKFCSHGNSLFSNPHPPDFNMLVVFGLENINEAMNLSLHIIMFLLDHTYEAPLANIKWNAKGGQ